MGHQFNLAGSLSKQARLRPDATAIVTGARRLSYGELADRSSRLAGFLEPLRKSGRIGILGTRSPEAYVGLLGACWAGSTYVPLNIKWPAERLIALLHLLDLDAVVADEAGAALLTEPVLDAAPDTILLPKRREHRSARPNQRIWEWGEIDARGMAEPVPVAANADAYVIFTSGTTGLPKGVVITAGSLAHYIEQTRSWTDYHPEDRLAEVCDLSFDLSVHNLFLCLDAGAELHVASSLETLAPAAFIRRNRITVWMSVPTIIGLMRRSNVLQPGIFPSLRLSIFCGEPLPVQAVEAWAAAAPNSVVENIYGPTECTVICLRQRLTEPPVVTEGRGVLAIGKPYETMRVAILDSRQEPVAAGLPGEIALCGPQVGAGYFGQPELTEDRFRTIDGVRWYLTGDLGRADADGVFHHLGRVDNQVKVKGNRIELEEVDAHLRMAAQSELVATVAWPVAFGSAEGLVGFVGGSSQTPEAIRAAMLSSLPRALVPGRLVMLEPMPQNINGKIDRRALLDLLEAERAAAGAAPEPAHAES